MKKFFLRTFIIIIAVIFPALLFGAQAMVVRIENNQIYLDISELADPVNKGDTFKIILSTEKLTNPKTGKDLGEINRYSETGTIVEVKDLFAVGEIHETAAVSVGMNAVLEQGPSETAHKNLSSVQPPKTPPERTKHIYEPIAKTVISISSAKIISPEKENIIILSEDNEVSVWERAGNDKLNLSFSYRLPKGKQAITVSAVPVKENEELAQIFVSVYDSQKNSISTLVLENQEGKLVQTAVLPYFTKELGCASQKKVWAQRPFVLNDRPGNAHQLVFKNGKYVLDKNNFSSRRNWLTGLNYVNIENTPTPNLIYTASDGTIRMVLSNGKRAESAAVFAGSPNRLQYKQTILKFHPSLQVINKDGNAQIVAVEHTPRIGLLSGTFGQYKNAILHWITFEKGRLELQEQVELAGVVYDTACSDDFILAAEVLPDGTSNVAEISK